jgi:LPS export ABC transporter protein LptC
LRNQEAARYARWAAMTAGAITLVVVAFYVERAVREALARRHGPAPVPVTVHQESAGVSYSFSNKEGTTFTIRASHATQFKEGDHALLEDVWVTIYGKKGDRNDNIHTRECTYQPVAENIQCTGDVEIDIQAAPDSQADSTAPQASSAVQPLHVTTSNITFDKQSGEASTPSPVNLTFAGGQGHGIGLDYNSQQSMLRVQRDIQFDMSASDRTGGLPVNLTAANLEFHRDERTITLGGPVSVHQGDRQLNANRLSIVLDKQYHAQEISAEGSPVASGNDNGAAFTVSAQKFQGTMDANGGLQQITAEGGVNGVRKTRAGDDHFSAAAAQFTMLPGRNLLQQMLATGGVTADSSANGNLRTLKTDALRITFAAPPANAASGSTSAPRMDKQQIESAETLGPATIESTSATETVDLKAAKFNAEFDAGGKLAKLLGHSGVEITRTPTAAAAQAATTETSTAAELVATFGSNGDWSTLDETAKVQLAEGPKQVTANHARMARETDTIALDGSPVFTDGMSRTSAGSVTINQKTGDMQASGGVVSTELAASATSVSAKKPSAANLISLGEGDAHISAESLSGSTTSGDVTFRGHARLWQGQAVLQADQIEVSRDAGRLNASGNVVAVFPQQPGQGPELPSLPAAKSGSAQSPTGPVTWQVRSNKLTYSNAQSMAHLEGGVTASSIQGTLHSQTLDIYLAPPTANTLSPANAANAAPGGRALQRAVAQGNVVVSQNGVHGYAEQADYEASQGKFTFSGGQPRITDANGNTTTGRSLTFDVASDTISIVSDEGSRTLTTHRVEK